MTAGQRTACAAAFGLGAVAILVAGGQVVCPNGLCHAGSIDRIGLAVSNEARDPRLDAGFAALTWLGSLLVLLPAALLLGWKQRIGQPARVAAFMPAAVIGAALLGHLVKLAIDRPRPEFVPALAAMPVNASYPSAHAMQATAFALAYIVRPAGHAGHAGTAAAVALCVSAILVGVSRVYLQVHFPSDVLFGAAAAILWVLALRALPVWPEYDR